MMNKIIVAFATLLSGCSLDPQLTTPALPVPSVYGQSNSDARASDLSWREMFADKQLQDAIDLALVNNRDMRIAVLNAETVRAQYRIERASRLPAIDTSGSWSRQRFSEGTNSGEPGMQNQGAAGVNLSAYEIDLFGRVKSLSEAAYARYLASEAGTRSARISLITSVSEAWYRRSLAMEQIQLSQQTLTDWQASLNLARQLKAADQTSQLDVVQAEGQVATAEADVEANKRSLQIASNALRLMMGTDAPLPQVQQSLEEALINVRLDAGLPSELLTRRPDIILAEQNLIAANADIGAARAAFFPRISLTASYGQASPQLSQLFDSGNRTWQFTPQISIPIFQGGRLKAELDIARIRKNSAIAEYEKSIQVAFSEISDGLAGKTTYRQQMSAQKRVVASAQQRVFLSSQRYEAGLDSRLEVLDSQRQYYSARQILLTLRLEEITNAINLYKSLGGESVL